MVLNFSVILLKFMFYLYAKLHHNALITSSLNPILIFLNDKSRKSRKPAEYNVSCEELLIP